MPQTPTTQPDLSVVIPFHDAEPTLAACLAAVFASRGVSFEVVAVDDGSRDRSRAIALGFPCRVVALRSNVMAANARNLGARHARAGILVFVDADEVLPPDALARYAEVLRSRPEIDAVVGSYAADTPMPGFFSRFKNLVHHHTHQTARPEGSTLHSGLTAIRREAFWACGGFEPAFGPASIEDIALGYKLHRAGHRILFRPEIQVTHLKGYSLRSLVVSDVVHRAIPWTGLMLRERIWRSDLNTGSSQVVCVALAWLAPLCLLVLPPALAAAAVLALGTAIGLLNRGLLARARRDFGAGFALRSLLFLPVMYFYQGAGLLAGLVVYAAGGSVARVRSAPRPEYEVLEGAAGASPSGA